MAKRLVFLFVFLPYFVAVAQGVSGSWSVELDLLPSVGLSSSSLSLSGEWPGWTLSGTGYWLGTDGWVWQELGFSGAAFDTLEVDWTFLFGPLAPAFLYSLGTLSFSYGGADFTVYSAMVGPNVPGYFFSGGPSGGLVIVVDTDLEGISLSSETGFGARLSPFTITYTGAATYTRTYPVDPFPGGLRFTYQKFSMMGIPFCCDISFEASLAFNKEEGFESLALTARNVFPICCDISFDIGVTFTTAGKSVWASPKLEGVGEACFELYLDLESSGGENSDLFLEAIRVDGWKLRYELADCNYLEIVTFLSPEHAPDYGYEFEAGEFEYIELGFCGPACCGGDYAFSATAYFRPSGALFGLSRIVAALSFPLAETAELELNLVAGPGGVTALSVGWTVSF